MVRQYTKIICYQETRDKILDRCVEEYLKHHPEDRYRRITQDFILNIIADHYIKDD